MRPFRERKGQRPSRALVHSRHRGGLCPLQREKRKLHTLFEIQAPVKAVSLVATGGGFCISSERKDALGRPRSRRQRRKCLDPQDT